MTTLNGGPEDDILAGGPNADILTGGGGNDMLYSAGAVPPISLRYLGVFGDFPTIDSGREADTLSGGSGDDFLYAGYGDTIDGGDGLDALYLSLLGAQSGVTIDFHQPNPTIGGGAISNVEDVRLVIGTNFADTIVGGAYRDVDDNAIFGMGGDDHLTGGEATFSLHGGDGDDTIDGSLYPVGELFGDDGNDVIIANSLFSTNTSGGGGNDLIYSGGGDTSGGDGNDHIIRGTSWFGGTAVYGDAGDDLIESSSTHGDSYYGGDGADIIHAGSGNDNISTGDIFYNRDRGAEHDVVDAGDGDDIIIAGYGDTIDGGAGYDTLMVLSLGGASSGVTLDTTGITGSTPFAFAGGTIANIEEFFVLEGSAFNDVLDIGPQSSMTAPLVQGGDGDDVVIAHGGPVGVQGEAGNDRFIIRTPTSGINSFDGGDGDDTIDYRYHATGVTLTLDDPYGLLFFGPDGEFLQNIENIDGSAFADTLTGTGLVNALSGKGGDDLLNGGGGNDLLDGGDGHDVAVFAVLRSQASFDFADNGDLLVTTPNGATASLRSIEAIQFSDQLVDAGDIARLGTAGDDDLSATANGQFLAGLAGNDILRGGSFSGLTLKGGSGNDTYYLSGTAAPPQVQIVEAANGGTDTVHLALTVATLQAVYTIPTEVENLVIDTAIGASITGNASDNHITGGGGGDALSGLGGNDVIEGGGNNDLLIGGDGDDILTGNAGDDQIDGGAGTDIAIVNVARSAATLTVHGGNVTLNGGVGPDVFFFGSVAVTSSDGTDSLSNVETIRFTDQDVSLAELVINGTTGNDTLTGTANANSIFGGNGNDVLRGLGGDDTLYGGRGTDFLDGGDGVDTAVIHSVRGGVGFAQTEGDVTIDSRDGSTTLRSVEFVQFDDQRVAVADLFVMGTPGADDLSATANGLYLSGGDGNDILRTNNFVGVTLVGGAGNDTYYVDQIAAINEAFVGGNDTIVTSVDLHHGIANVETIRLADGANVPLDGGNHTTLIGNALDNMLFGYGDDILIGGLGDDTLGGGGGDIAVIHDTLAHSSISVPAPIKQSDGSFFYPISTIAVNSADGHDWLVGIGRIEFNDGTIYTANLSAIDTVFTPIFGRHPTTAEYAAFSGILQTPIPANQVQAIYATPEFDTFLTTAIAQVYQYYGGRAPTSGETDVWKGAIRSGVSLAQMRTVVLDDPLGRNYSAQVINQTYSTYGGRAPVGNEVQVWQNLIRGGATFDTLRNAILNDPLGQNYANAAIPAIYQGLAGRAATADEITAAKAMLLAGADYTAMRTAILGDTTIHAYEVAQINAAYQTYGGRAASSDELAVWDGALKSGASYGTIRDAILSDPLGNHFYDRQITAAYQTYGGRAPTSGELAVWEGALRGNGDNAAVIKDAILHDPLGRYYVDQQIAAAYQTYGGRAPTSGEIAVWEGALRGNGGNATVVRDAILGDPLGKTYVDAQINAAYQTYGGRAASAGELQVWEGALNGNNHDFGIVRSAILNDPLGINNSTTKIAALYQRYFQRAPGADEQNVWHAIIRDGKDFDQLRDVLMSDGGSAATTTQLNGTIANDAFHFATKPYLAISGFDAAHDVIDLQGLGFSSINPLDSAHARQIHAYDGTNEVLITLDGTHEILLRGVQLSQLSSADFVL